METDWEITRMREEKRQGGKENRGRAIEQEKESGNGLFMRHVAGMQRRSGNMPCFPRHSVLFEGNKLPTKKDLRQKGPVAIREWIDCALERARGGTMPSCVSTTQT